VLGRKEAWGWDASTLKKGVTDKLPKERKESHSLKNGKGQP
jgi:hypothetical protein